MNNKRILIVGVLAVIVTLMVGYALFSETITINGTATSKGDFSISTSCQMGLPSDSIYNFARTYAEKYGYTEGGYDNDSCMVSDNIVTVKSNFQYPGASRYFMITYKNTGSINATNVTGFDVEDTMLNKRICADFDSDNDLETCDDVSDDGVLSFVKGVRAYAIKPDGTIIDTLDEDADVSEFTNDDDSLLLQPGYSIALVYAFGWNQDFDSKQLNGKLWSYEFTLKHDFTQITN